MSKQFRQVDPALRILIVIPAYNEEKNISEVIHGLRAAVPDYERVVVIDGAKDRTGQIVDALGEKALRLPCNLGYGHALQTGLKYALHRGYDVVVSFDADGQHRSDDVRPLVHALLSSDADVVIGSRYCQSRAYNSSPERKIGQQFFSYLTRILIGRRIYDTTSGFKAMRIGACGMLVSGVFMDFHTEAIVRLSMAGLKIVEHPITVHERTHGHSMHTYLSILSYPMQTLLLTAVAAVDALLARKAR